MLSDVYKFDKTNIAAVQEAAKRYIDFPGLASIIRGK
jgi:hypothetical protein